MGIFSYLLIIAEEIEDLLKIIIAKWLKSLDKLQTYMDTFLIGLQIRKQSLIQVGDYFANSVLQ